ncbi:hypothetical protein AB0A70_26545 [Streptomyces morookaense]|uniref:hypothetical protein n=1 Tax=Streptomyces morookaense TaxID=1970 RepID=UPI0033E3DD0F
MPTTASSTGATRLVCGAGPASCADLRASNRACLPAANGVKSAFGCFGSTCGVCLPVDGTDRIGRSRGTSFEAVEADTDGAVFACTSETINTVASANMTTRSHDRVRADILDLPPPSDIKAPPNASTSAGICDPAGRVSW